MSVTMEQTLAVEVEWTTDFIVIDGSMPAEEALAMLALAETPWIVISREDGVHLYALRADELETWLRGNSQPFETRSVEEVLALSEQYASTQAQDRHSPPPVDRSWRPDAQPPSVDRWVEIDAAGRPAAVGIVATEVPMALAEDPFLEEEMIEYREVEYVEVEFDLRRPDSGSLGRPDSGSPGRPDFSDGEEESAAQEEGPDGSGGASGSRDEPAFAAPSAPHVQAPSPPKVRGARSARPRIELPAEPTAVDVDSDDTPDADEGTRPVRFPSLEADRPLVAGEEVTITVDLLRQRSKQTQGGAIETGALPEDWKELELSVAVSSSAINFDDKPQPITIVRNAASTPAEFTGTVKAGLTAGEQIDVTAAFFHVARFCGSALRRFFVGAPIEAQPVEPDTAKVTAVIVEPGAQQPDVTVFIETLDKSTPGKLRWRVEPAERFDGLPSCLRDDIDLGKDPAETAQSLFKKFAVLTRGKHRESLEGFGDELWSKAPVMFHQAYWALVARYGRRLTIQFICDEPHLPWELMRPSTPDETQLHAPLALQHSVARWIDRYRGDMRNSLPGGSLVSIAPKYANARYALPKAQDEHEDLIKTLGATRLGGSRAEFLKLLDSANPMPRVGVLHFAGHGVFTPDVAAASSIKLENGETLTASEVKRKEVQLGRTCRTLVFFNACEVGATGSVFGEVGGWADAFLDRKFGGFIAPLWAVEEDDSAQVAAELLDRIYARRAPIGEALREIREKYADKSPTYFSYLYYGDVTARLAK